LCFWCERAGKFGSFFVFLGFVLVFGQSGGLCGVCFVVFVGLVFFWVWCGGGLILVWVIGVLLVVWFCLFLSNEVLVGLGYVIFWFVVKSWVWVVEPPYTERVYGGVRGRPLN
jgi:hypothetical protein